MTWYFWHAAKHAFWVVLRKACVLSCTDAAGFTRGGVYYYTLSIPDSCPSSCVGCQNCLQLATNASDPAAEAFPSYAGSTQDYQLQYIQALSDPCQQFVRQS